MTSGEISKVRKAVGKRIEVVIADKGYLRINESLALFGIEVAGRWPWIRKTKFLLLFLNIEISHHISFGQVSDLLVSLPLEDVAVLFVALNYQLGC